MTKLNSQQEYLLPYIEKYQSLVKELGDSITDYQNFCGVPSKVTQQEMEWLIFQFYPALKNNLDKYLPYDQAKDILQTIRKDAGTVISNLSADDGYAKYRGNPSVANSDIEILERSFTATKIILEEVPKIPESGSGDRQSGNNKMQEEGEQPTTDEEKKVKHRLKTIINIFVGIVFFLAALFTCIGYFLGWLEPIKAFISKYF
jgi:hypothetical protein